MLAAQTLDDLIDLAVSEAELQSGVDPKTVAARSSLDRKSVQRLASRNGTSDRRSAPWTLQEELFLRHNMPYLGLHRIAQRLGRSKNAVKIRATRIGIPGPSRTPGVLTARRVGWMLGCCSKKVTRLMDEGIMPGWIVPEHCPGGNGELHLMLEVSLFRWAVNPNNWPYFNQARVKHPRLKRLIARKAELWSDEWVTTGQAADIVGDGIMHQDVNRQIELGKLEGVKFGKWYVRRSDIESYVFHKRKGTPGVERPGLWTDRSDAFIVSGWLAGLMWITIASLMGWEARKVSYRFKSLVDKGAVSEIVDRILQDETLTEKIDHLRRSHA